MGKKEHHRPGTQGLHRYPRPVPRGQHLLGIARHPGRRASDDDPVDANIQVDHPGAPLFQIFYFNNNAMLSTDGTEEQAAEVAAWAANTFPKSGPGELWMTDQGYSGHTALTPGMTAADIWKGWQELS